MVYFGDYRHKEEPRTGKAVRCYSHVEDIEQKCARTVTIETALNDKNLAKCHPQDQSPLFKLPAELRSMIFHFACLPYDDEYDDPWEETAFYYRPEHRARHVTDVSLLLTCRRAWLETNHLPLQLGDHSFWFRDPGRRPKYLNLIRVNEEERLENFLSSLTINGCHNLKHVHIYAQMIWLEQYSGSKVVQLLNTVGVCPEILTITVRSSDWWWWEYNQPLRLDDGWISKTLNWQASPRLREIRLELEIVESYGDDMQEERISQLRTIELRLRRDLACVKRVDNFGSPIKLVLHDQEGASSSQNWRGKAVKASTGPGLARDSITSAVFKITRFAWRVEQAEDLVKPKVEAQPEADPTEYANRELPLVNIDQDCPPSGVHRLSGENKEACSMYEQQWKERDSLLKFAGKS